jgi:dipeptidyl-peptidase-4
MKKTLLLLIVSLFLPTAVPAQKRNLTIDDIFDVQKRVPFSGRPAAIRGWTQDGKSYLEFVNGSMFRVDALTGSRVSLVASDQMADALIRAGFNSDDAKRIAGALNQRFNIGETAILVNFHKDLWLYNIAENKVTRLTKSEDKEEKEGDFSPDSRYVSFVRDNNLFIVDTTTLVEKQITRDGDEKTLNGILDWVYEEELYGRGNKRGYWWSPDSNFIAFLRTDESPVPKFIIPDDTVIDQRVESWDYPQAGDPNPLVRVGIADIKKVLVFPSLASLSLPMSTDNVVSSGDVVTFADLSKYTPENLLISRVAWSSDSKGVLFQVQDREQTFLDLSYAPVTDGKPTVFFREGTSAWIEAIDNPDFLSDGSFAWLSEKSGFKHLYHYDRNGRLIRQITDGRWEITTYFGINEKEGYAYFSAIGVDDNWLDTHVYRIKTDGTKLERLTKASGTHRAQFNKQLTHFVDVWSDVNTPPQTRLYAADGSLVRVIDENPVGVLSEFNLQKPEFMRVKTRDGFEMEAMMIKPADFDPSKQYPVFAYTYAGPHAPQVRNQWGGARFMWHQMLAQRGYIIWIVDNKTASGKGVESTWPVYKQMGQAETPDIEDGFTHLKSLPYIDRDRIGMWGWSYGGYMTSYFMTQSKTLKMGIAGGLVADWALYDSIYTERYMRTPQNNPDGYSNGSVLKNASNLHGRLLIIHGTMDENVHMQNSIMLAHELQKAGKQFDFMPYPTQRHGVVEPRQQKHMYTMMTEYILRNL